MTHEIKVYNDSYKHNNKCLCAHMEGNKCPARVEKVRRKNQLCYLRSVYVSMFKTK